MWSEGHSEEPLSGAGAVKERNWDSIKVGVAVESLLAEAVDEERARLLAAGDKISGAWLHVLSAAGVPPRLEPPTLRPPTNQAHVEEKKCEKYSHLVLNYIFQPMVMETSGVIGPNSLSFLSILGSRQAQESGKANSTAYLLQRLSIAVQRGNAVAILGCARSSH